MGQWWLVRADEYEGGLAAAEWEELAATGRQWTLAAGQQTAWGPSAGVILVRRGTLHLSAESNDGRHTLQLQRGDMVGTLHPNHCRLLAQHPTTLRVFHHDEWLAALQHLPNVTQKLLQGMAWNALRVEQQLPPPPFSAAR